MSPTPVRGVRIPDDLWKAVKVKAEDQGSTASAVIIRLLRQWVRNGGRR